MLSVTSIGFKYSKEFCKTYTYMYIICVFGLCSIVYIDRNNRSDVRLACDDGQSYVERASVARLAAGEYQPCYSFY